MVFEFSKLIKKYPIGRKVTVQSDGHTDRVTVAGYRFADRGWYIDIEERGIINEELQVLVRHWLPGSVRGSVSGQGSGALQDYRGRDQQVRPASL